MDTPQPGRRGRRPPFYSQAGGRPGGAGAWKEPEICDSVLRQATGLTNAPERARVVRTRPPYFLSALMMSAGLFLGARAPAQDALLSALVLDRTLAQPSNTNAPVIFAPDQPHIGPVRYTLGVYAGAEYNDNI